jgi:selT/selW/selH-like putative selenoprotein
VRERFESRTGTNVELVRGAGGVFEITVDGTLAFSKKALGRFPEDRELDALVAGGG